MTYKEKLTAVMSELSLRDESIFLGYNILFGGHVYGTMTGVGRDKCLEMPIAENLISGVATGLAMTGYRPVLIFERHDFIWVAMDMLINHIDKIEAMSGGQYTVPVTIRAIVGSTLPLNPGPQHRGDYTEVFKRLFSFPVIEVRTKEDIEKYLERSEGPRMFVEWRAMYNDSV